MAAFNKFNNFVHYLMQGKMNFSSGADVLKDLLTNTAPVATNSVKADLTEISAGNGYTAGGTTIGSSATANSSGTETLSGSNVVFTASGGNIGPFRYVVELRRHAQRYADRPADRLVGLWQQYHARQRRDVHRRSFGQHPDARIARVPPLADPEP
jgi:hypothetical protein